jgi:hypothetical protein
MAWFAGREDFSPPDEKDCSPEKIHRFCPRKRRNFLFETSREEINVLFLVVPRLLTGGPRAAYDFSGSGSAFRRARTIEGIYGDAAPLPDAVMPPPSKEFLMEVRRVVTGAIEASGGRVQLDSDG